jgi:SAM-dependent methyltransferase
MPLNPRPTPADLLRPPDPPGALERRSAVWTRHWSSGAAHSCVGSFDDTYAGALRAHWSGALSSVQDGHRILDIATGSGALPRLITTLIPERSVTIDAIDIATIEWRWTAELPAACRNQINVHPGRSAEQLPFEDERFDLIASQYGLEYSQLDLAVPELLRVLAPGGRVALLMHHAASRPVTLAAVEIGHLDWLLSADGLLAATRGMLEPMARAATPQGRATLAGDAAAEAAREAFNAAQDVLRGRAESPDGADVLFEARDAAAGLLGIAAQQGEATARRQLKALVTALEDSRLRLQELRECALTPAMLEAVSAQLRQALPIQSVELIHEQGHLMGWAVSARACG